MVSRSKGLVIGLLAVDDNFGIGFKGALPWGHNRWDMKLFRGLTQDEAVVMGKKTWDSLPFKPLPKRINFVLTSISDNIEANTLTEDCPLPEIDEIIYVIGGASTLEHYKEELDAIVLSHISGGYKCDTHLPKSVIEDMDEVYLGYPTRITEGKLDVSLHVKKDSDQKWVKAFGGCLSALITEICLGD